ncbi:MAG: hypothetical protein J2P35_18960, partial [Actinobacteria bacterium]|nr:hypothetical protein [Actinomycetota bacterium]
MADNRGRAPPLEDEPDRTKAAPPGTTAPGDPAAAGTPPPRPDADGQRPVAASRWVPNPSLVALLVWLASLPAAVIAVRLLRPGDPFALRTALVPLAAAAAGLVIVGFASWRFRAELVSGFAAGLFAGWAAFTLRLALHGTPFGFSGLGSDAGRLAAMANRYS